jgi:threonine synthase
VMSCARRDDDPLGDPCLMRFRDAVAIGAIPFSVQGPENAWCLDGGRTLGFEIATETTAFDRVFIQVGGGAFAACVGGALVDVTESPPRLHAVQAEGCAPLERAWRCAGDMPGGRIDAAAYWRDCMAPWPEPFSLADGILDDETYDWLGVLSAMDATGGWPVVAAENEIVAAHDLMTNDLGRGVSPTGTAGLAGLMAIRDEVGDDERVVIVASGVAR